MAVSSHGNGGLWLGTIVVTAAEDFAEVAPFEIRARRPQRAPFVFNSPHSGRVYPARFLELTRLDPTAIRRSEDCYVDELFHCAVELGAPMLAANFPRAYIDVNREPWELDPRMFDEPVPSFANVRSTRVAGGLGTVPRLVGEGLDIYASRLPLSEATARIDACYRPYHDALKRLIMRTHATFGHAVLIDCHSMPASIRVGEAGVRPDFIIGDRFGASASAALTEAAKLTLVSLGYKVAHNKPYAGGFITEHYGRPARRLHALQIEVNRGLYMDERTLRKNAGFDALAADLRVFCARIMGLREPKSLPLAAE